MRQEVLITKDGSATVIDNVLNATYHSSFGAITESRVIFIEQGLKQAIKIWGRKLSILEIGFGTGLNAFLTLLEATGHDLEVQYEAVEQFPLSSSITGTLNYAELTGESADRFNALHQCAWNEPVAMDEHFTLKKLERNLVDLPLSELRPANLVYYDAFAPATTPELWRQPVLEKMFNILLPGGSLVTFCAKGEVKRALKNCGFLVEALPGPPGKRETTRAVKPFLG